MIYINGLVIVASAVLAILSRKHYSKYKDSDGVKGSFLAMGLAMGHSVWTFFNNVMPLDGLKGKLEEQLRKNNIISPKRLEIITDRFIAKCIAMGLGILFTFNLLELGSAIYNKFLGDEENIIEREEYGGDVIEEEIYYEVSGQEQTIVLNVSPVRLSEDEFYSKADHVAMEVEEEYLYKGEVISQDIELPIVDSEGVFAISWVSDNPEIMSSRGRIKTQLTDKPEKANIRMFISYYDYIAEYEFQVLVGAKKKSDQELKAENLEQALNNLEQETVDNKELLLPDEINDVKIKLGRNQGKVGRFLILGIVMAVVVVGVSINSLMETGRKRDKELMGEYPFFVDSLWLYIEAGMTVRRAINQYIGAVDDRKSILVDELKFTLNQIDNGEAEYVAYEELGTRLNLPVYVSLMRHISQNLKMGTRDLRALMETEVSMALEAKKETAKRLGEEASTKLVFPMIVLLLAVMIIIMTPAFMGF